MNNYQMMTIIGVRKLKQRLLDDLMNNKAVVLTSEFGKSGVNDNNFFVSLGLVNSPEKIVITCLIKDDKIEDFYRVLNEKHGFKKKNTGIAFCTKVDKIAI